MTAGDRPLVVIRAGASWDGTRLADRHVATLLAARADVVYVDPPLSFRSDKNDPRLAAAAAEPPFRELGNGLWRLTPRVPPRRRYPILRDVSDRLVASAARRAVRSFAGRQVDAVLSVSDDLLGVLPGRQVYWARDDYSAGGDLMRVSDSLLQKRDRRIAERAELAVGVTPSLVEKWERAGLRTSLVPNGVDADLFGAEHERPVDFPEVPGPIVGFCGTISARIDLSLLHAVADRGLHLVIIGAPQHTMPRKEFEQLFDRSNVHWLGTRGYEDVPAYVQAMDVGLVPYTDSMFNRASFPLKMLEYLAAGVPVVATDLPAVRWLDTDLVSIGTPQDFVELVEVQAGRRSDPDLVHDRRAFAARHSWAERTDRIAEVLGI